MYVGTLYRRAFWSVAGGVAMFLDFTILPIVWVGFDVTLLSIVFAAAFLTFIITPLTAWRVVERCAIAGTVADIRPIYYRVWELDALIGAGKQAMLWGSPAGWLTLIVCWLILMAAKRWPTFALAVCVIWPEKRS